MPDAPTTETLPRDDRVSAVRPVLGVIVGLVPFALRYNETRTTTVTDAEIRTVTRRTSFDYVAVPCGVFALVLGVVGFAQGITARRLAVGLAGIVAATLGIVQLVRGYH